MNHVIVTMNFCWADEFDVEALWVTSLDGYKNFVDEVKKHDFSDKEVYFGTNEAITFDSTEKLLSSLRVHQISSITYNELLRVFKSDTFGLISIPSLLDMFEEEEEDE